MCLGAAQAMLNAAALYNQPMDAWDVGKVTNMDVRLASEGPP